METAIALAAPPRLFIHNCRGRFKSGFAAKLYRMLSASRSLKLKEDIASEN